MMTRVMIEVSIDEFDDEALLAELRRRRLPGALRQYDEDLAAVALAYLREGLVADAVVVLERLIEPKWPDPEACARQYHAEFLRRVGGPR